VTTLVRTQLEINKAQIIIANLFTTPPKIRFNYSGN